MNEKKKLNATKDAIMRWDMNNIQYTLVKIPIKEIINQDYNVTIDRETEIKNEYLITQGTSLLFDQIERLRGKFTSHINEVILIVAKKNPKQEECLRHILNEGFIYKENGTNIAYIIISISINIRVAGPKATFLEALSSTPATGRWA